MQEEFIINGKDMTRIRFGTCRTNWHGHAKSEPDDFEAYDF